MWKQLDSAIAFAATAHAGQLRKYSMLPYIVHPIRVMTLVHDYASIYTEDQLVAAALHDVVEDTPVTMDTIERRFGSGVAALVFDLTDQYTSEAFPDKNRFARKALERSRLASISPAAQTIKYADLIDNTSSIVPCDPGFARNYLAEKEALLQVMREGDSTLLSMAEASLTHGQNVLLQLALEKNNGNQTDSAPALADKADRADVARSIQGAASITSVLG